jgi:hypothetical protein
VLLLGHMMFDCNTFGWKIDDYPKKVQAFLFNAERMFGTKEGEFQELMKLFEQKV